MCKAEAYKRLKTMENNLTVTLKSGYGCLPEKVIYKRWKPQGKFDWTFWCFGSVVSYGGDCLPDQRCSHTEVWLCLHPSSLHFCSSSFLHFRKLCLVWLVEVLDRTLGSSVLTVVNKHVNMDSIALSILPSGKHPFSRFNKNLVWKRSFDHKQCVVNLDMTH